jgi:hypothetical protein
MEATMTDYKTKVMNMSFYDCKILYTCLKKRNIYSVVETELPHIELMEEKKARAKKDSSKELYDNEIVKCLHRIIQSKQKYNNILKDKLYNREKRSSSASNEIIKSFWTENKHHFIKDRSECKNTIENILNKYEFPNTLRYDEIYEIVKSVLTCYDN